MSKPVTEVMAATFYDELMRLKQNRYGGGPLGTFYKLDAEEQADFMSAMAEVTRMFGMFGITVAMNGDKPVLRRVQVVQQPKSNVVPMGPVGNKLSNRDAKMMGYSGEQCSQCQSFKTIRNGTCITCTECLNSGECG